MLTFDTCAVICVDMCADMCADTQKLEAKHLSCMAKAKAGAGIIFEKHLGESVWRMSRGLASIRDTDTFLALADPPSHQTLF